MISRRAGMYLLSGLTLAVVTSGLLVPRRAQPLSYHQFADQRGWGGIPNFQDVASNIVFAAAGLAGLWYLGGRSGGAHFIEPRGKCFYVFIFLGLFLTALVLLTTTSPPTIPASCGIACRWRWFSCPWWQR